MPDVGILNLQIHDNSEQAVQGLTKVAGALQSIKEAVNGAKIGTVATQLKRIATVVNESMNDSVINRIERFCTAMSKLNGLGNININMRGADRIAQTMESIENGRQAMEQVRETASEFTNSINTGFDQVASRIEQATTGTETFYHSMERTNELVANMGWSAKATADQFAEMFKAWTDMRSAMSLGPGEKQSLLGDGSGGSGAPWTYWKDGAIEVEGTVTEAMDNIDRHLEGVQARLYGMSDVQDMGMGQVFYSLEDAASVLGISVEEAQRRIDDLRQSSEAIGETPKSFASIEEAAQAMGISVEEARRRVVQMRDTIETNVGGSSAGMAEAFDETAQEADLVRQRIVLLTERIQQMRETLAEGINVFHWDESQITKALLQINSLERQLDGLQHKVNMENMAVDYGEEMVENLAGYYNEIDLMTEKLEGMKRALAEDINMNRVDNDAIASRVIQIQHLSDKIDDLRAKQEAASRGFSFNNLNVDYGNEMVDNLVNNYSQIDLMQIKLDGMKQALADDINMNRVDTQAIAERTMQIQRQAEKIEDLKLKQEETTSGTHRFKDACDAAKKGLKDMFPFLERVRNQFSRIVLRRAIMAVLKSITSGFKEGVENVYRYSQAVGTSFAPAMDTAASKLLQMKNSIGAAVAPIIEALIPVLRQVVDWFIGLVNYANQFFALMTGQKEWTRALETGAKAYDDVKTSAKGASKATKDLLADWDELNIIQSKSGGGGSGSSGKAATNFGEMFEQVSEFDTGIKDFFDFINDNMKEILATAGLIGTAVLGWKVSAAFAGVMGTVGAVIAAGSVMGVTFELTTAFDKQYNRTGKPGWLIADAVTNLVGSTLAGTIIGRVLGGSAGLITSAITLVVSAGISYGVSMSSPTEDQKKALQTLSWIKLGIGTAAMAAGFGLATGSGLLGLAIGATAAPVLFTLTASFEILLQSIHSAEEIARNAFNKANAGGISVADIFEALNAEFKKQSEGFSLVIDAFEQTAELRTQISGTFLTISMLSGVVKGEGRLTQKEAEEFRDAWKTAFDAFEGITAGHFDTIFAGLNESLTSENEFLRNQAKEARISAIMIEEGISSEMAKIKERQLELVDKIKLGKASKEDMDEYFANLAILKEATGETGNKVEEVMMRADHIDFGAGEEAVDNALSFISDIATAEKEEIAKIDEGLTDELKSVAAIRATNEALFKHGKITKDVYDQWDSYLDDIAGNFVAVAEEKKGKIRESAQGAIDFALNGVTEGLRFTFDPNTGEYAYDAALLYFASYIAPIAKAAKDAGFELDDELERVMASGATGQQFFNENVVSGDNRNSPFMKYLEGFLQNASDISPKVKIKPTIDVDISDSVRNEFEESIYRELNKKDVWAHINFQMMGKELSGAFGSFAGLNSSDLMYMYNLSHQNDIPEYNYEPFVPFPTTNKIDDEDYDIWDALEGKRVVNPARMMAYAGYASGVNFVPSSAMGANETVETEDKAMVDAQNRQIAQISNVLVPLLQQILQKPLTVNLAPSSDWGQFNDRSYDRFSKVNGNP